jgi:glycosyltransferase involved in cell wall biosynthesis
MKTVPAARMRPRGRVAIVRQTDLYEPAVQRSAEALTRAGFDVEVICMRHPDRPRRAEINDVAVISLPAILKRTSRFRYAFDYVRFFLLTAWTLTAHHIRRRYAAVQVNTMPDFLVFAAIGPKLLGSRVLAYMNEPMPELAETVFGPGVATRLLGRVEPLAIRFADHAFTVSEELKERFVERGAPADRISVVLNGADPNIRLAGWSPPKTVEKSGFVVVCHGAIEDRYGQDTIIEAARLLRDELPDLRVVFTGRGSYVAQMLRVIEDAGLHDMIRFEGWVPRIELNDILHAADVGVVAQKASPYSHLVHTNKMVDYWIHALPVIASRLRAVSALYGDEVLEYYAPGDAADLARAIRRLHDEPRRRDELARNGRLAQERNGWAVQQRIYLGVYDELLGDHA